ncbi:MAG: PilN domain-containing protein [Rhodanobacteraceae bacterium]|nr:PilN domain-containing protein [Rhodanobacteraceae bacterium]
METSRRAVSEVRCSLLAMAILLLISVSAVAAALAPDEVTTALKQLAPDTLMLDQVEFVNGSEQKFLIIGRADTNASISQYLRALDTSASFQKPDLLQISMDANGHPRFEIMIERKPMVAVEAATNTVNPSLVVKPKKITVYRCTIDGHEVFQSLPCPAVNPKTR